MIEDPSSIVEKVGKSVVAITTRGITFDDIFSPHITRGIGSGFAIEKGLIVTSFHVIENAQEIRIISKEGISRRGYLLAINPFNDLALIGTDLELPPLKLSREYKVGNFVLAIGNPLGMESVTFGIISGSSRLIKSPAGNPLYVLQTDAAVNPGNSGGPLVNMKGEVVGVVTAMIPYAQGIGFAIPSRLVESFVNNYKKFGRYVRAYVGISIVNLTTAIARYFELPVEEGVLVVDVSPNSPAYYAGIRRGDIIIEVDGKKVKEILDFLALIDEKGAPAILNLQIIRGNKKIEIELETVPID